MKAAKGKFKIGKEVKYGVPGILLGSEHFVQTLEKGLDGCFDLKSRDRKREMAELSIVYPELPTLTGGFIGWPGNTVVLF